MKFIFDLQRFDSHWHTDNTSLGDLYCSGYPKTLASSIIPDTWTDYGSMKKGYKIHSSSTTTAPSLKKYITPYSLSDSGYTTTLYNCELRYIAEGLNSYSNDWAEVELNAVYVSGFYNPAENYSKYVELGGSWQMLAAADFTTYGTSSENTDHKPETEIRIYKLKHQQVYYDVATTTNIKNELLSYLNNAFTSTNNIVQFLGKDHFPYYHNTITGTNDTNGIVTKYRTTFNYSGTNGNVVNYVANIIKKFIIKI